MSTRWFVAAAVLASGVGLFVLMPPSPMVLGEGPQAGAPMRGAIHVHTRRSDGTGTVDEVAAAARRAGLQFVIFTDHGDGTKGSDTPAYRYGVLCIDALEVSTNGGHVVVLGLPQTPYPLAGEAGDVIEDVRRMGGMSIAAHPDSPRPELAWADWDVPVDGIEWLNSDSQWRDETWPSLLRALVTYPLRRAPSLATMLDRPVDLLNRFDALTTKRSVVALAGTDAHARVGPGGDPYGQSYSLHIPAYEQVFRTLSISLPGVELHGNAKEDAQVVLSAIRAGHVFSSIDALATPARLTFSAASGSRRAVMGDRLPLDGPVMLRAETNAPPSSMIHLLADGKTVASAAPPTLEYTAEPTPAVFRVEVEVARAPGTPPIPWIVSNPIYAGAPSSSATSSKSDSISELATVYSNGTAANWRIEKSARSEGTISVVRSVDGTQLLLRYGLGGTLSESPFVAAAIAAGSNVSRFDRIIFNARAMHPMRITFEMRASGEGDRRWGRSVYLDEMPRTVTIAFDDMLPMGTASGRPAVTDVQDLLFVVDTVHSKQGASGQFWFDEIKYAR